MNASAKQMIGVLAADHREPTLRAVMNLIDPSVSSILDLGCGIGALTSRLAQRFPLTFIVGIDQSLYLLKELKNTQMKPNILLVQGELPNFPLKPKTFDLVVAVQVLHEVFHFKGKQELLKTISEVYNILCEDGKFIVLDHQNPGNTQISIHLSNDLINTLNLFELKFKPRTIKYKQLENNWVRMNMRDFYDFVTKIWALNTPLEDEEMNETHTPFTSQEFAQLTQKAGFEITYQGEVTPINNHLEHYKIDVRTKVSLPKRHFILRAKKRQIDS
ncbi:MAG: class I SAM-dependent methyltransferase [Candidatus Odinarchaeota archaeon]